MALDRINLFALAKMTAAAKPAMSYAWEDKKFTAADLNDTLRNELNELVGTYALYRENKNLMFALIETVVDDILPVKVMEQYGQFAEIKQFGQGEKPVFTQRVTAASRRRAKQFITKVGLAGVYEVFKLDGRSYEVTTSAYGGAAQVSIEEFLDGRVDFAEVLNIVMEGLDEAVYREIAKALIASVNNLQAANKYEGSEFIEEEMDALLAVADSYGGKATIYCTFEFAATMIPSNEWFSDSMKEQKWNNGYLANYKGHQVIVLQQSYEDETNTTKVIDPAYAWIIPGGAEKPVKIAFEGAALVDERTNKDWSREVQVYKKMGVAATINNDICVYKNDSLTTAR